MRRRLSMFVCAVLTAVAQPYAAEPDIVLYATDALNATGNWSRATDSTTTNGQMLLGVDQGWSTPNAPLAAPAHYFEFTFSAPANTPYHLWLRLRAAANSKYNDSVFVQFSDAVNPQGAALYRIGTASGLDVNLQSCNGCGLSGWGWIDGAYWLSQQATVSFATAGTHTLRIQTREDGVQFDELVLSPSTYLSRSPGQVTNDQTKITKPAPSQSTPYSGTPAAVPGVIQAENFDNGGEGVAYHDSTSGNAGGAYRSTGVDLEAASSGGYDVGWVAPGEWLNYRINVAAAGSYTVNFRVAALGQGGTFHLEANGANVTGSLTVPNTGGWQNWQTVTKTVSLTAGAQTARLVMDSNGTSAVGNFDSFAFVSAAAPPPPPPGTTINVPAGGDLQAAIDNAHAGDTILLAAGATYRGTFILPAKSGSTFITIRSAAADSALPAAGVRITPQNAAQLPKIQGGTAGLPAFRTERSAHHYRLMFLEIISSYAPGDIMRLGDGGSDQNSLAIVPHDLVVDRCYIHGSATAGQKRGISLNASSTSILNSYISDIKLTTGDAQAIMIWNAPGPFTIVNNYLEASGENFLVGGADPTISGLVPSDITFRLNHVAKPPSWRGQAWVVKNLLEFKNAQRVVIDSNIVEYNWAAGQKGHAFVITPVNQDGGAPWTVVQHIQVTNNIVRHVASAAEIQGLGTGTSMVTNDIVFRNNLFVDISKANWGGAGQLVLTLGGANIVFDHNTVFTDGSSVVYADVSPVSGFVFTNNIVPDNAWAVMGANASEGNVTLALFFPGATFKANVLIGSSAGLYPTGNYFPLTVADVGFTNLSSGDYRLLSTSPYANAAIGGGAIGCSVLTLPQ